jgi:hypothetical protein
MTSTDAISPMSIILSFNDPRLENLEHRTGDKFLFKPKDISQYDFPDFPALGEQRILVEVVGYMLFDEGDLGYTLRLIEPEEEWVWGLRASELEDDFIFLGNNYEEARFVFIND